MAGLALAGCGDRTRCGKGRRARRRTALGNAPRSAAARPPRDSGADPPRSTSSRNARRWTASAMVISTGGVLIPRARASRSRDARLVGAGAVLDDAHDVGSPRPGAAARPPSMPRGRCPRGAGTATAGEEVPRAPDGVLVGVDDEDAPPAIAAAVKADRGAKDDGAPRGSVPAMKASMRTPGRPARPASRRRPRATKTMLPGTANSSMGLSFMTSGPEVHPDGQRGARRLPRVGRGSSACRRSRPRRRAASVGSKPMNQASVKSLVVPVLPAIGRFSDARARRRAALDHALAAGCVMR